MDVERGAGGVDADEVGVGEVFLVYPAAYSELAAAVSEALLYRGRRVRPGPPVREWPFEAWKDDAGALAESDRRARQAARAVVLIWGDDAALDADLRREGDRALARTALAAVLCSDRTAARLPPRFAQKRAPGGASVEAVADAVAELLEAARREGQDPPPGDRAAELEARIRRLTQLELHDEALAARLALIAHHRRLFEKTVGARGARERLQTLAAHLADLAERLFELDRPLDAERAADDAAALYERLEAADRNWHTNLAHARALVIGAVAARALGRTAAVAAKLEVAAKIFRAMVDEHPMMARTRLAAVLGLLADARLALGRRRTAEAAAREAAALFRAAARSGDSADLENLANALTRLAEIQLSIGRRAEAAATAGEAVDVLREYGSEERDLVAALLAQAEALRQTGAGEAALASAAEAVEQCREASEYEPDEYRLLLAEALAMAAALKLALGDGAGAAKDAGDGLALLAERVVAEAPERAGAETIRKRLLAVVHAPARRRVRRLLAVALAGAALVAAAAVAVAISGGR